MLYTENWSDARSRAGVSTQPVASLLLSVVQLKKEQHSSSNILFASMSSQQIAVQEVEEKHAGCDDTVQYSTVQYSTVQYSDQKINIEKKRLFNPTHLISK